LFFPLASSGKFSSDALACCILGQGTLLPLPLSGSTGSNRWQLDSKMQRFLPHGHKRQKQFGGGGQKTFPEYVFPGGFLKIFFKLQKVSFTHRKLKSCKSISTTGGINPKSFQETKSLLSFKIKFSSWISDKVRSNLAWIKGVAREAHVARPLPPIEICCFRFLI